MRRIIAFMCLTIAMILSGCGTTIDKHDINIDNISNDAEISNINIGNKTITEEDYLENKDRDPGKTLEIDNSKAKQTKPTGELNSNLKMPDIESPDNYKKVPNCTIYSLEDEAVELYNFLGKPMVLNFWGPWCEPCEIEMPVIEEMYNKYKDDITFISICNHADKTVILEDYGFDVYYDKDAVVDSTFNINAIPLTLFINSDGQIVSEVNRAMTVEMMEDNIKLINIGGLITNG